MARIVVLGSGTGVPTEKRSSPGLVVELDDREGGVVLVDPGPGAVGRMARIGIPVHRVDRVLITHLHVDHTLDIMALLFARRNAEVAARAPALTMTGPVGLRALLEKMKALYGKTIDSPEGSLKVVEIGEGALPPETGVQGSAWQMEHTPNALGYRIETGTGTLAISGDSAPCKNLVALGRGVDLFLLECAMPDHDAVKGHMTPSRIGPIAKEAAPRKLVLYHLYPAVQEEEALATVRTFFSGSVCIAEDGAEYNISLLKG